MDPGSPGWPGAPGAPYRRNLPGYTWKYRGFDHGLYMWIYSGFDNGLYYEFYFGVLLWLLLNWLYLLRVYWSYTVDIISHIVHYTYVSICVMNRLKSQLQMVVFQQDTYLVYYMYWSRGLKSCCKLKVQYKLGGLIQMANRTAFFMAICKICCCCLHAALKNMLRQVVNHVELKLHCYSNWSKVWKTADGTIVHWGCNIELLPCVSSYTLDKCAAAIYIVDTVGEYNHLHTGAPGLPTTPGFPRFPTSPCMCVCVDVWMKITGYGS